MSIFFSIVTGGINVVSPSQINNENVSNINTINSNIENNGGNLLLSSNNGKNYDISFGNKKVPDTVQEPKNYVGDLLQIGGAVNSMLPGMQIFQPAWSIAQASNNIITAIKPTQSYWIG
ncbi:hypothetical protein SSABA_v1c01860 [Spiroplasma sabaudiense Ar-1343]|uniref:Uncharacterized protein n=1 Tax=Spiroplasma sabaudiense Ar-1343 TaxID=1276257 RepID=W6A8X0_9MOLU|nr:hypothetical protein [Spiroplasma sabaudiense]AHI53598.1 hypothetical protein SSABA_v1c01860 [Spiroplasma sabaudiense Ar-1343]